MKILHHEQKPLRMGSKAKAAASRMSPSDAQKLWMLQGAKALSIAESQGSERRAGKVSG